MESEKVPPQPPLLQTEQSLSRSLSDLFSTKHLCQLQARAPAQPAKPVQAEPEAAGASGQAASAARGGSRGWGWGEGAAPGAGAGCRPSPGTSKLRRVLGRESALCKKTRNSKRELSHSKPQTVSQIIPRPAEVLPLPSGASMEGERGSKHRCPHPSSSHS